MNFDFLNGRFLFKQLHSFCKEAEEFVISHPELSAISSRKALENVVKIFYTSKYGEYNERSNLYSLIQDAAFSSFVSDTMLSGIHLIRIVGNNAAHGEIVRQSEAMKALEALYFTVNELMRILGIQSSYPPFDKTIYTKAKEEPVQTVAEVEETPVEVKEEDFAEFKEKIEETAQFTSGVDFTEAETRKVYIDAALREAGWKISENKGAILPNTACIEIKLEGMPNHEGVGYADYVLFDDDNKPLAVIEAKKTAVDENVGAQQAKLYADCIEKKWGVRPVIYYTNGYKIQLVDGAGYPARRVFGYYTKDELHSLIVRRDLRDISDTRINPNISDRYFIQEACTAVCEAFNQKRRMALTVMATGTGKTRCAISIVDVLQRAHWVKNVLFLADRTELVNQAKNAFVKHLPDSSVCAISEESKDSRNYDARIILSTYPTMLNLIDEDRQFGIGKFDLIILDECHRSVYNKYMAILRYFDGLILGLTATPREQVDKSTYTLFNLPDKEPTYNYDFAKAVAEGFLVDYARLDCTSDIMKNGLKYENLSDEEKEDYEQTFADDEGKFPKEIDGKQFYQNITNLGTIDLVLQTLMTDGLKVQSGERLGKTIIFAHNHSHAQKIVDRFHKLYPQYGDTFCQLIDYSVNYVRTRIEDFKTPEKDPVIAVSVDMLDTGVDVPEILNLVFFKRVFSVIKFWQMIGRGTRTRKELFVYSPCKEFFEKEDFTDDTRATYADKQGFFIFDFCNNFAFFQQNPKGREGRQVLSLSQKLFELKLDLVFELQRHEHQANELHKQFYEKWKEEVKEKIKHLNRELINVSYNLQYVDKYSDDKSWDYLTALDLREVKQQLTPLIEADADSESAKKFDLWLFNMELTELVGEEDYSKAIQAVTSICSTLLDMTTIPAIAAKKEFLEKATSNDYWQDITIQKLEDIRIQVRDLLQFLALPKLAPIESNFKDSVEIKRGEHLHPQFKNYKQRVIDYLAENVASPVISKIRNIEPLNQDDLKELQRILWEELGSQDDYAHVAGTIPLGVFVRRIVGLDREAVGKMFAEYLAKYNFNAQQEEFLHQIITFVLENGDIEPSSLIKDEPFSYVDYNDIFDGNTDVVFELIARLHSAVSVAA